MFVSCLPTFCYFSSHPKKLIEFHKNLVKKWHMTCHFVIKDKVSSAFLNNYSHVRETHDEIKSDASWWRSWKFDLMTITFLVKLKKKKRLPTLNFFRDEQETHI